MSYLLGPGLLKVFRAWCGLSDLMELLEAAEELHK